MLACLVLCFVCRSTLFDACIKNLTNLIKQYFSSIISVVVTLGLRVVCGKIAEIRHIVCQRREARKCLKSTKKMRENISSNSKNIMTAEKIGTEGAKKANLQWEKLFFLLLLLTFYLVIVCYVEGENVEPAMEHKNDLV